MPADGSSQWAWVIEATSRGIRNDLSHLRISHVQTVFEPTHPDVIHKSFKTSVGSQTYWLEQGPHIFHSRDKSDEDDSYDGSQGKRKRMSMDIISVHVVRC